jgi:coenzyme F420-reducing hydrogenase gamma subunit
MPRAKLAVWKFASCDGCQLSLLDCEDELLALAGEIDIAHFLEASRAVGRGPYDVSLVEGSITTAADARLIRDVRRRSKTLITIGACATAGGIQALRNMVDVDELRSVVYASPNFVDSLATSTPIAAHVPVDVELRGCPIDRHQLLDVLAATLQGRRPDLPTHSVCFECKSLGRTCVLVAHGTPCLGPITQAGCGALCPSVDRGCYGCFGPAESVNAASLLGRLRDLGATDGELYRLLRTFNTAAPAFAEASETLVGLPGGAR